MAKKRRQEQRAQKRIAFTIQLVCGEDDDLIEAIRSIDKGQRQAALKNLLRMSYGMPIMTEPEPPPEPEIIDRDELERDIYERLMQQLEQRLNNPFVPPAPPSVETVDQIDQQTAIERKRRLSGANW